MSKFNTKVKKVSKKTTNLAGGAAYLESSKLELASAVLTSMMKDNYYENGNSNLVRITELVKSADPAFVANLALYARHEFGLRSISHLLASSLASAPTSDTFNKRNFYKNIVRRPDDITEILSCYKAMHAASFVLPNAMKRGLADSFGKFNTASLAKYKSSNKEFKLVDAVNLLHPTPTILNTKGLKDLVNDELVCSETWESELSEACKDLKDPEAKRLKKISVWKDLLLKNKLGYFAVLRNLRNILDLRDESLIDLFCEKLLDVKAIKASLVLPFRFQTAYEAVEFYGNLKVDRALNAALEASLANVPQLTGKTLVVLDSSGSMQSVYYNAAMLALAIYKKNDADFMLFDDSARYVTRGLSGSLMDCAKALEFRAGGTDFTSIFAAIKGNYDRIVIISDMQGWGCSYGQDVTKLFRAYKSKHKNVKLYSFDLAGYGTLQFPEKDVYCLTGVSDKVFNLMAILEQDREALIHTIENYTI